MNLTGIAGNAKKEFMNLFKKIELIQELKVQFFRLANP